MIPSLNQFPGNEKRENYFFTSRVGETVGGHRPASSNLFKDGGFLNFRHFDAKLMGATKRGKKLRPKKRPKNEFYVGENCVSRRKIK